VGNSGFRDLGDFSQRRKILGSKNSHVFRRPDQLVVILLQVPASTSLKFPVKLFSENNDRE
jgi:hypothetical protein